MSAVTNSPQISLPLLHDAIFLMSEQGEKVKGPWFQTLRQKFKKEENQRALSTTLAGNYRTYPEYGKNSNVTDSLAPEVTWTMRVSEYSANGQIIYKPLVVFEVNPSFSVYLFPDSNQVSFIHGNNLGVSEQRDYLVTTAGEINIQALSSTLSVRSNPVRTMYIEFLKGRISTELPFIPPGVIEIVSQFIFY